MAHVTSMPPFRRARPGVVGATYENVRISTQVTGASMPAYRKVPIADFAHKAAARRAATKFREWRSSMSHRSSLLSPRRQQLSSFENSYAVALQRRRHSGVSQFILRTSDPLQPFRTTSRAPKRDERIVALVA